MVGSGRADLDRRLHEEIGARRRRRHRGRPEPSRVSPDLDPDHQNRIIGRPLGGSKGRGGEGCGGGAMGRHHHARSLPRRQQQPAGQIGRGPNLAPKHPHAYAAATAGQAPGHATPPTQRRRSARRSRGPPGSAATAAAPEAEPSPPGAVAVVERRRAREREAPPPPSAARASPGGFLRRRRGRGAGERGWRRGGLGFPRVASQATRGSFR